MSRGAELAGDASSAGPASSYAGALGQGSGFGFADRSRGARDSLWSRAVRRVREAVFTLFYHLRKDSATSHSTLRFLSIVHLLQLLSLSLWSPARFPWRAAVLDWLEAITSRVNFGENAFARPSAMTATAITAASVLLTAALCSVVLGFSLGNNRVLLGSTIRYLRAFARLGHLLLLLPFAAVCAAVLSCGSGAPPTGLDSSSTLDCGTVGRTVLAVACGAALAFQTFFLGFSSLVMGDHSPSSRDPLARAAGRVPALCIVLETALCLFLALLDTAANRWTTAAVLCSAAVIMAGAHIWWPPYLHRDSCDLHVAKYSLFAWSTVCLIVAQVEGNALTGGAALSFLMGAPFVAAAAVWAARARVRSIIRSPLSSVMLSPALAELHLRRFWRSYLRMQRSAARRAFAPPAAGRAGSITPAGAAAYRPLSVLPDSAAAGAAGAGAEDDDLEAVPGRRGGSAMSGGIDHEAAAADGSFDWTRIESALKTCAEASPASADFHLQLAHVYECLADNLSLALSEAQKAVRLNASVDTQFAVFCLQRKEQERTAAGGTSGPRGAGAEHMTPLAYMAFEHHMERARHHTRQARHAQIKFWAELVVDLPDLNRLYAIGSATYRAVQQAQAHYEQLMRINDSSPAALRLYASFTLTVLNDQLTAQELLNKADQIEDARAAMESNQGSSAADAVNMNNLNAAVQLDMFDERNGMMHLDASPERIGTVVFANPAICRITGHRKAALMGNNVNKVVPDPFAEQHDSYLRRYLKAGTGRFMNFTRNVYILHRLGYIIPAMLTLRESVSGAGAAGSSTTGPTAVGSKVGLVSKFVGVLRPVDSSLVHILVDASGTITAACTNAMRLIGASVDDIKDREVRLDRLLGSSFDAKAGFAAQVQKFTVRSADEATIAAVLSSELQEHSRDSSLVAPSTDYAARAEVSTIEAHNVMAYVLQIKLRIQMQLAPTLMAAPAAAAAAATAAGALGTAASSVPVPGSPGGLAGGSPHQSPVAIGLGQPADERVATDITPPPPPPAHGIYPGGSSRRLPPISTSGAQAKRAPAAAPSPRGSITVTPRGGMVGPASMSELPTLGVPAADVAVVAPSPLARASTEVELKDDPAPVRGSRPSPSVKSALRRSQSRYQVAPEPTGGADQQQAIVRSSPTAEQAAAAAAAAAATAAASAAAAGGGDKKKDDRASSHGSSHNTKASSRFRSLHRVIEIRNRTADPALVKLRRLLLTVLVLFSLLSMGVAVMQQFSFSVYFDALDIVHDSELRAYHSGSIAANSYTVWLSSRGLVSDPTVVQRARDRLQTSADILADLQRELYARLTGAVHNDLMVEQLVGNATRLVPMSIWTAGIELSSRARMLLKAEASDYNGTQLASLRLGPQLFFITRNALPTLMPAMQDSASAYSDDANDALEIVQFMQFGVAGLVGMLMLVSITCGYCPTVQRVESTKNNILMLFLDIPVQVVRSIISSQQALLMEEEHGGVIDEDELSDQEQSDRQQQQQQQQQQQHQLQSSPTTKHAADRKKGASGAGSETSEDVSDVDEEQQAVRAGRTKGQPRSGQQRILRKHGKSSASTSQIRRSFRYSAAAFYASLIKFSSAFVVAAALFAGEYFASEQTLDDTAVLGRSLLHAGDRLMDVSGAYGKVHSLVLGEAVGNLSGEALAQDVEHLADHMLEVHNAILYGDPAHELEGINQDGSGELQRTIMLRDSCLFTADGARESAEAALIMNTPTGRHLDLGKWGASRANCSTFADGVASHGAHSTFVSFIDLVRQLVVLNRQSDPRAQFGGPALNQLRELVDLYLLPTMLMSTELYWLDARAIVDLHVERYWLIAGIFTGFNFLLYLFVYRVLINKLDDELRHTRSMLLLVPGDVASKIPSIMQFIKVSEELG